MKNWKTTTLGALIILGAVINLAIHWLQTGTMPDVSTIWPALLGGWGLIHASDAKQTPPPPVGKIAPVIALAFVMGLSGCAWVESHQEQIKGTVSLVAKKAFTVAGQAVISAAVDEVDKNWKANFLDSIALGLRSNMGDIVTSDDVKQVVAIWSPNDGDRWQALANGVSDVAGPAPSPAVVEQIATGLNDAAAQARATTL